MAKTKIEWATHVWNPVTGCTPVSAGCKHCYAAKMARRLMAIGTTGYENGFAVTCHPERLEKIPHGNGKRVFVCSMGDLFHSDVPHEFIAKCLWAMLSNPDTIYMILTKRAMQMRDFFEGPIQFIKDGGLPVSPNLFKNIWVGVSAENQEAADERIPLLLEIPAAVRFVSCEPMLGETDIRKYMLSSYDKAAHDTQMTGDEYRWNKLDWVICGGESGPGARPMHPDWARSLRDQCSDACVPFFFKQWGGKAKTGNKIAGVEYRELPNLIGDIYE